MTMTESARYESVLAGIGWMVLSTLLFVCVTGIVRYVGSDIPAPQAAFIRYAAGLILLLPWLLYLLRHVPPPTTLGIYALRGMVHGIGVIFWFYAMARIPIAEVTALSYATPIFVTIGAVFFLGEKPHLRRILAIVAGLIGTIIILRPGFAEITGGHLAQLAVAPLFATSYLLAKRLTADANPLTIVAMLSVFCTLTLLPAALLYWVTPSVSDLAWLSLSAVFATAGHYAMTRAIRAAPLTVTQPIGFLQLIWAGLLGIVAFGEPVDPLVILGGGVVVGAATFISHREARAARGNITPPAAATKY